MLPGVPLILLVSLALALPASAAAAIDLQGAIDAAPAGSTVTVPADTYDQAVTIAKDLRLQGEGVASVLAPSAAGSAAVIQVTGPANVTIARLRIDLGTSLRGIRAQAGARLAVEEVTVSGDATTEQSGVVFDSGASGVVRTATISDNRCAGCADDPATDAATAGGAGVLADGSGASGVTVVGSTLTGNRYGVRAVAAPRIDVLSTTVIGDAGVGVGVLDCDAVCGGGAQATQGVVDGSTLTRHRHGLLVRDVSPGDGLVPGPVLRASRVVGNGAGVTSDVPVRATSVWWGCNDGPSAPGCDTVGGGGAIATTPNLVLRLLTSASSIATGGATAQLTADLSRDSAGEATATAFPQGTVVSFTTSRGTVSPGMVPTTSGAAAATLTSGDDAGAAAPTATLDGQTVGTPVTFTRPPPPVVVTETQTQTQTVTVAPTAAPLPTPAPPTAGPTPLTGAQRIAAARKAIGSKVVRLQKAPAPGVVYVSPSIRRGRGTLTVPYKAIVSLMVLVCPDTACDAGVSAKVSRVSRKKGQKLKSFNLRRAEFSLGEGRQRVVAVRLTKSQRDGIRRARRATMRVVIAVSDPAGKRRKRTLSVTLKVRTPAK